MNFNISLTFTSIYILYLCYMIYTPDRLEQDETEFNNECSFCGMPCEHIFCNRDCETAWKED